MIRLLFGLLSSAAVCNECAAELSNSEGTCPENAASLLQRQQQREKQVQPEFLPPVRPHLVTAQTMPAHLAAVPDAVLAKMVLPGPYPCGLTFGPGDDRFKYCGGAANTCISLCDRWKQPFNLQSDGLHPANLSNASQWSHSTRLLSPIGSLPCCPTPPHCNAPTCKLTGPVGPSPVVCTPPVPTDSFAYINDKSMHFAFSSGGGSQELDVYKHWNILGQLLGCYNNATGLCRRGEPFDIAVDLGSDWGSVTAALSSRKFAKDYILLDAWPKNKESHLQMGQGNKSFNDIWYKEQVVGWPVGKPYPTFDFLSYALSNETNGFLDICAGPGRWHLKTMGWDIDPCPVPIVSLDALLPGRLTPVMQTKFAQAESLYLKIDLDGFDQLTIDGGRRFFSEVRGTYPDGTPRYLVNFMMLEFCPTCMVETQQQKGFTEYDLGTNVRLLLSMGFETFLIGPRYIPLSGASWLDAYKTLIPGGTADLFAMRASHPRAAEIKLALGSCAESKDFNILDEQYVASGV